MPNPEADNIVYNLNISNNSNIGERLEYDENRSQHLIEKSENYYCRIFQAKIPVMAVPFMNLTANSYYVSIGSASVALNPIQLVPGSNYVFYIEQFLESLNNALTQAHNNFFITSGQDPNSVKPPLFYYDYENNRLFYYVAFQYKVLGYSIYFNRRLMFKLSGFYNRFVNLGGQREYEIIFDRQQWLRNTPASIPTDKYPTINYNGYMVYNQAKYYKDLQEFQSVIISTRSIKINEQYITNPPNSPNQNNSFPILAELPITFDEVNSTKYLNFAQLYPKWTDINASGPLSRIDIYGYIVDDSYNLIPLILLPGQRANIRLEFINKSLVKNYIN